MVYFDGVFRYSFQGNAFSKIKTVLLAEGSFRYRASPNSIPRPKPNQWTSKSFSELQFAKSQKPHVDLIIFPKWTPGCFLRKVFIKVINQQKDHTKKNEGSQRKTRLGAFGRLGPNLGRFPTDQNHFRRLEVKLLRFFSLQKIVNSCQW